MDWLACRAARGTYGLHPGVWSRSRICSGFSRSDGQAATHGHTNCWLLCFRHRVFDSQDQLQLANYLRADCCRFFAHLFDSHWSDSKQLGKARLKLSDRSLPDLSGFSFARWPLFLSCPSFSDPTRPFGPNSLLYRRSHPYRTFVKIRCQRFKQETG